MITCFKLENVAAELELFFFLFRISTITTDNAFHLLFKQKILPKFYDVFFAGRVFCKKACDADGDTWEECKFKILFL